MHKDHFLRNCVFKRCRLDSVFVMSQHSPQWRLDVCDITNLTECNRHLLKTQFSECFDTFTVLIQHLGLLYNQKQWKSHFPQYGTFNLHYIKEELLLLCAVLQIIPCTCIISYLLCSTSSQRYCCYTGLVLIVKMKLTIPFQPIRFYYKSLLFVFEVNFWLSLFWI